MQEWQAEKTEGVWGVSISNDITIISFMDWQFIILGSTHLSTLN